MDALRKLWDSIPTPFRTVINVAAAAALTALMQYLVSLASPSDFDPNTAVDVLWVAINTAIIRALNPADTVYGLGKGTGA